MGKGDNRRTPKMRRKAGQNRKNRLERKRREEVMAKVGAAPESKTPRRKTDTKRKKVVKTPARATS